MKKCLIDLLIQLGSKFSISFKDAEYTIEPLNDEEYPVETWVKKI